MHYSFSSPMQNIVLSYNIELWINWMVFDHEPSNSMPLPEKYIFGTVTFTSEPTTLKMSSVSCGPSNR